MRAVTPQNLHEYFKNGQHHALTAESAKSLSKVLKDTAVKVDTRMEAANAAVKGFGIEVIRCENNRGGFYQDICALYVNTGDTYNPTVLFDAIAKRFYVTTMGDFVEAMQEKYEIL